MKIASDLSGFVFDAKFQNYNFVVIKSGISDKRDGRVGRLNINNNAFEYATFEDDGFVPTDGVVVFSKGTGKILTNQNFYYESERGLSITVLFYK